MLVRLGDALVNPAAVKRAQVKKFSEGRVFIFLAWMESRSESGIEFASEDDARSAMEELAAAARV